MTPIVGDILESTAGKLVKGLVDKFLPKSATEVEKQDFEIKGREFVITELKINQETIDSVNKTMQAEAKSEYWMQWAWRPTVGFTFASTIINNYILLPYLKFAGLEPIIIPDSIWQAMLIVLGVSAGTRGLEKWEKSKTKAIRQSV
ncbi:MAG: hypothetical protein KAT46_07295 [Deltaproteobacteria bacterium]|nr:hypothetical protein [Deltaproteobacteria bacterium]